MRNDPFYAIRDFFRANPHQALTMDELASKFGCDVGSVRSTVKFMISVGHPIEYVRVSSRVVRRKTAKVGERQT